MAYIEENNGNKSVNVELNLVPFIDLMSVCIIFLLITAVWTQVSMIQLGTSIHSKKIDEKTPPPSPPQADIPFVVNILNSGYAITLGSERIMIPIKKSGVYSHEDFLKSVREIKQIYPDKIDVVISSQNNLLYKDLVMVMDLLLEVGFTGMTISTGEIL